MLVCKWVEGLWVKGIEQSCRDSFPGHKEALGMVSSLSGPLVFFTLFKWIFYPQISSKIFWFCRLSIKDKNPGLFLGHISI